MRAWFCALIFGLLVSGCASPGPAKVAVPRSPLGEGMARITVQRSTDILYLALSASVKVNGIAIGALSRGDVASIDVKPGPAIVSVDTESSPGSFSISFTAQPNHEYLMEVSPRSGSFLPGALLGYAGEFMDSAVNEQSGLFQISEKGVKTFDMPSPSSTASKIQPLQTTTQ